MTVAQLEQWRDKRGLAEYCGQSVRWVEEALRLGLPYTKIGRKKMFKVSKAEPWLYRAGLMKDSE